MLQLLKRSISIKLMKISEEDIQSFSDSHTQNYMEFHFLRILSKHLYSVDWNFVKIF